MIADTRADLLDHPVLSRVEESRLLKIVTHSDSPRQRERAVERLARHNMRLVESIARKYSPPSSMSRDHLFAAGLEGLHKAIRKFDLSKNVRLSTYATNWIRQSVTREIEDFGHTIRIPSHMNQAISRERRARTELSSWTGTEPSDEKLAEPLGVKPDQIDFYREVKTRCHYNPSLDTPTNPANPNGPRLGEELPSEDSSPDASLPHLFDERYQTAAELREAIQELPDVYAKIVRDRFGLSDRPAKSLREVGDELGISPERVRQKQLKATEILYQKIVAARSRR